MKKKKVIGRIIASIIVVWILINLESFADFWHARTIVKKGLEKGNILTSEERESLRNYERDLLEIRIRGCTLGAKLIFVECLCPKLLQRLSLCKYWQEFESLNGKYVK